MFLFHHPLIPGDRWVLTSMNRTWLIGWGEGTLIKTRWKPLTPRLLWAEWRCLTFFSKICFCQTWGSLLFLLVTILIECLVYSCEEASHQLARKSAEDEQTATSSSSLPCCQRNGDEESRASRLLSSTAPVLKDGHLSLEVVLTSTCWHSGIAVLIYVINYFLFVCFLM